MKVKKQLKQQHFEIRAVVFLVGMKAQ